MKIFERGVLLFLVLVLALSSGSSYLSLHQATKTNADEDKQKMTIALVNEDQGAKFNGDQYEFGNEFIRSIEGDPTYDWYVVSRGVAESGLKRNAYNMMIVIPTDFTQKALAIDSKAPEKAKLTYKINATDNENVNMKAEKAASTILEDFNRRIIDVYFASVIGNLQEAQDNIGSVVEKEKVYTYNYTNTIYQPLVNYSSQFKQIKSNTKVSKDSFEGLNNLLNDFGTSLGEGVNTNQASYTNFTDFTSTKVANELINADFTNRFSDFDKQLNNTDIRQQLQQLELANEMVNSQFQNKNGSMDNILLVSAAVQSYLKAAQANLDQMDTKIADRIVNERQKVVAEKVKKEIESSTGEEKAAYLKNIFAQMDRSAKQSLQKQMDKLPSLNVVDIDELDLNDTTKTELKNVIAVTNKYKSEFGYTPNIPSNSIPLSEEIRQIKNDMANKGVTINDSISLEESKDAGQELSLTIPKEFSIRQVLITLPKMKGTDYTGTYLNNWKIILPATSKGNINIKLNLALKDINSEIDVFQPINWSLRLTEKGANQAVSTKSQVNSVENDQPTSEQSKEVQVEQSTAGSTDQPVEQVEQEVEKQAKSNTVILKSTVVENNYMEHQVMSPLISNATGTLINSASDTVSEYQRMLALYNNYFGLDMDSPELASVLNSTSLSDLATKDSLFYLFEKQDIVDFLTNFVVDQIIEEVRNQAADLKSDMNEYIQLVNHASQNSAQLEQIITDTTNQVEALNQNLSDTLSKINSWRDNSLTLQDLHEDVLVNEDEENSYLVTLDGEFKNWLEASQSLAAESKSNLDSADGVYQTFDAIDHQATEIQNSGVTLVKQANDLSANLSDKLMQDQKFADNFKNVLANSRIGERPNENLFSFLSNPVQTENEGIIINGDTTIPYFLVLICFIVALFAAYTISINERKRPQKDSFEKERSIVDKNIPIAFITAGIGLVEGLVIGISSGYILKIPQEKFMLWIGLITLIMLAMQLLATYLLRQLKMLGMFVLLLLFSLYLFLTKTMGLYMDKLSFGAKLRSFSPLEYIEKLLMGFSNGEELKMNIIFSLIAIIAISFVGQLFVLNRFSKSEVVEAENTNEAH